MTTISIHRRISTSRMGIGRIRSALGHAFRDALPVVFYAAACAAALASVMLARVLPFLPQ